MEGVKYCTRHWNTFSGKHGLEEPMPYPPIMIVNLKLTDIVYVWYHEGWRVGRIGQMQGGNYVM